MTRRAQSPRHNVVADIQTLRSLHVPGAPLLLANVWDPPTARMVEAAGMRAIATTSAGIAPANGYEDHGRLPPDVAFAALRRIADAVQVPVTADLEDGYGLSAEDLVESIVNAGACGFNLEDTNHSARTLVDPEQQAERIAAIKVEGRGRGFDLVVNARIDVQFHGRPIEEGLQRARKYLAAGADSIYPILLSDVAAIREYVALGPTNVLCRPGGPRLGELVAVGVSRISVGPYLYQSMLKQLRVATEALCRLDDEGIWK